LAARPIRTSTDLRQVRGLSTGTADRHAKHILAAIREGLECPPERLPEAPARVRRRKPPPGLTALLRAAVQAVAEGEDIAPGVIAGAGDIEALGPFAGGGTDDRLDDVAVIRGWRRELVGEMLLAISRGQLAIRYDPARRAVVGDAVRPSAG